MVRSLAVVLVLAAACGDATEPKPPTSPWQARGFVAHALGSPPDGPAYTNSREAFEKSYRKGFRAFEADLVRLRDGVTVLAHDLRARRYGLRDDQEIEDLTSEQMRRRRFDGRYVPVFEDDLVDLLEEHHDAVVVLDTKGAIRDQVAIARRLADRAPDDVRERMYPHVHFQEQLDALRRLDVFPGFVLSLYLWERDQLRDAPAFARRNDLDTVIVRPEVYTDRLRDALRAAGARWIFVHSFTTKDEIEPWRAKGVGVYSNDWIEPSR